MGARFSDGVCMHVGINTLWTKFYISVCLSLPWSRDRVAQTVKSLPTTRETWVWSLGQEDPLVKEMATHSSTLAWKIPWMEETGRLQSTGSQRVGHDWANSLHFCTHTCCLSRSSALPNSGHSRTTGGRSMNLHWRLIATNSPRFTLRVTLGVWLNNVSTITVSYRVVSLP